MIGLLLSTSASYGERRLYSDSCSIHGQRRNHLSQHRRTCANTHMSYSWNFGRDSLSMSMANHTTRDILMTVRPSFRPGATRHKWVVNGVYLVLGDLRWPRGDSGLVQLALRLRQHLFFVYRQIM